MLKPLENRVVLRVKEEEEKSSGGIVLSSAAQEKPQVAEVLALGPGRRTHHGDNIPMTVTVGDQVLFEKYAGNTVKFEGEELLIVKESDILAIL